MDRVEWECRLGGTDGFRGLSVKKKKISTSIICVMIGRNCADLYNVS